MIMPKRTLSAERWVQIAVFSVVMTVAVAAIITPRLPLGPDIYQHLVWDWQVMRCLAERQLPLWLPDLNAAFGS